MDLFPVQLSAGQGYRLSLAARGYDHASGVPLPEPAGFLKRLFSKSSSNAGPPELAVSLGSLADTTLLLSPEWKEYVIRIPAVPGRESIKAGPTLSLRSRGTAWCDEVTLVPDPLISRPICLRDACQLCLKACYMNVITMRDDPQVRDYRSVDVVDKDVIFVDTPVKSDPRLCDMRRHRLLNPPVRGDCARICPIPNERERLPERLQAIVREWRGATS